MFLGPKRKRQPMVNFILISIILAILLSISPLFGVSQITNQSMKKTSVNKPTNKKSTLATMNYQLVSNWDDNYGSFMDVAINDGFAYVISEDGTFIVFDISDPENPSIIGECKTDIKKAHELIIEGNFAYASYLDNGVLIFDISDKTNPVLRSIFVDGTANAYGLCVKGNYLFVAKDYEGLYILDVSNKDAPQLANKYYDSGYYYRVAVSNNLLFISTTLGIKLKILDISNVNTIQIVDEKAINGTKNTDLVVDGSFAYLLYGPALSSTVKYLSIFDFANTSNIQLIGSYDSLDDAEGLAIKSDYAYIVNDLGVYILDIANKTAPKLANEILDLDNCHAIALDSNYCYISRKEYGLMIYHMITSSQLVLVNEYKEGGLSIKIAKQEDYVFIADFNGGLEIFDVQNIETPQRIGTYIDHRFITSLVIEGDYAFLGTYHNGLLIIDISNKSNPTFLAQPAKYIQILDLHKEGDYIFAASEDTGVTIFNVTNPNMPIFVTDINSGLAQDLWIQDGYLYIVNYYTGLEVYDISSFSNITLVKQMNDANNYVGITISGNYAYLLDVFNGFIVLDISNPESTHIIGTYQQNSLYSEIAYFNGFVYLACENDGVRVINVSNPTSPYLFKAFSTLGDANSIVIANDVLFLAANYYNLEIYLYDIIQLPTFNNSLFTHTFSTFGFWIVLLAFYLACNLPKGKVKKTIPSKKNYL